MQGSTLQIILIFFAAAIVFVPIAKRLGIGSVLGYIFGGIVIGPYLLGLIGHEGEDIMHATEFGVVMMLFLIGLELNPQAFWKMRRAILGLGLSQMLMSAALFYLLFVYYYGFATNMALAVALSLAMSSTAIVLQTLKEKGLSKTQAGQSAFSVLLFQDIAVIPILAMMPLLSLAEQTTLGDDGHHILGQLTGWRYALLLSGVGMGFYLFGRYLVNPFLAAISRVHMHELFTTAALLIVIAAAFLMEMLGLSAALGAFAAGVLLANSQFRHELETDIEPFKGILLGMFFTAVGSTINFGLIAEQFWKVITLVFFLMAIKTLVLLVIGRVFKLKIDQNLLFALLLSQVGEFSFVLFQSAFRLQILPAAELDLLMAAVTVSMLMSPILLYINEKLIDPHFGVKRLPEETNPTEWHEMEPDNEVIIAGFGNFGSTVGRFLRANGVSATVLDHNSDRVALLRKMGFKVYFGDASRMSLLEAAGADKAKIFICAVDDADLSLTIIERVRKTYPHLKIYARAKNRLAAYNLVDMGLENIYREMIHASVNLSSDVLVSMGHRRYTTLRKAQEFIRYDEAALRKLAKNRHDIEQYILSVREEIELQEKLLSEDIGFFHAHEDHAWERKD